MDLLYALCLLGVTIGYTHGGCQTCYKRTSYISYSYYSCGFFGWSRCQSSSTQYRSSTYSCLCSVDGQWTDWSSNIAWSGSCSKSCGTGVEIGYKSRTCTNPAPENGGLDCTGSTQLEQTRSCKTVECPVDGGWSNFSAVTWNNDCSTSCDFGTETGDKIRTCTNPAPAYGGESCSGSPTATETRQCKLRECPIDGGWSDFSAVTWNNDCSTSCDFGTETGDKIRTCTNPAPAYGGESCSGSPTATETRQCKLRECPIDGGWTEYTEFTEWGACSVTCGVGNQIRTRDRTCTNPTPAFGGKDCQGDARDTENRTCDMKKCPDVICNEVVTGLQAHLQDCRKYLSCKDKQVTIFDCPPKLVWSQDNETCMFPEEGKTCMLANQTSNPDAIGTCSQNGQILPSSTDCHKFYKCDGLNTIEITCQNNLAWNTEIGVCDNPENVELCKTTNPEDVDVHIEGINFTCSENGQIHPFPTDCHKYYQCVGTTPTEMSCQDNLAWSSEIYNCIDPQDVELCKKTNPDDVVEEFSCGSQIGFIADPEDCGKYYWCVGGQQYHMNCGEGTHFEGGACVSGDCPVR